jgi:Peptidase family M23
MTVDRVPERVRVAEADAVFAHLAPGTVSVTIGQDVRGGELIGRVGHTGNSTAPHLHFELMDLADPLQTTGVPCAFAEYLVQRDGRWERVEGGIPDRGRRRFRRFAAPIRDTDHPLPGRAGSVSIVPAPGCVRRLLNRRCAPSQDPSSGAFFEGSTSGVADGLGRPSPSRIDSRRAAPSASMEARSTWSMRASTEVDWSSASPRARA